jgi:hypothetical protein
MFACMLWWWSLDCSNVQLACALSPTVHLLQPHAGLLKTASAVAFEMVAAAAAAISHLVG